MDGAAPHQNDEHDDLAVLDVTGPDDEYDGSEVEEFPVPLFAVTNPPGTVTVSTFMDGRVHRIDLSPKATVMTETQLSDEIVVIAGLAAQNARSAQYATMLEGMGEQGHDIVATRDFLARDLDLPSPEQTQLARAQLFADRYGPDRYGAAGYAGDHD